MNGYTEKIRQIALQLLEEKRVDCVIGFRKGSQAEDSVPCIIKRPQDVQQLIWDVNCRLNLANYLLNREDKIAVVAKGCDSRNIVNHLVENKIERNRLFIIGVPCTGMADKQKLYAQIDGEIKSLSESLGKISICSDGQETIVELEDVLRENCIRCRHPNPVIFDECIADPVPVRTMEDRYADIKEIEGLPDIERCRFMEDLLKACTRCYACRNACPLCYCPTCFVDESRPQWVGKGMHPVDIRTYHLLRAFHCAGRCTDCGACEEACPMDIPVRLLTKKLEKSCEDLYGWTAGLDPDTPMPLSTWKSDDPEVFFK